MQPAASEGFPPVVSRRRRLLPARPGPQQAGSLDLEAWEEGSTGDPQHKLILVRAGRIAVEGAHNRWIVLPGHLLFVPAGRPYLLRTRDRASLLVVHLDPAGMRWHHEGCWVTRSPAIATEMMAYACRWSAEEAAGDEAARALFATLGHLCRHIFSNPRILWQPLPRSGPLAKVVAHIGCHLAGASIEAAAVVAGVSVSTLQRMFRDELGMSWRSLLGELRMTRAMELLTQGRPVGEVAASVGFKSLGAFTSAFTRRVGLRPSEFGRLYAGPCSLPRPSG